jgi:hypothetical protein
MKTLVVALSRHDRLKRPDYELVFLLVSYPTENSLYFHQLDLELVDPPQFLSFPSSFHYSAMSHGLFSRFLVMSAFNLYSL